MRYIKATFGFGVLVLMGSFTGAGKTGDLKKRPNILFICSDQHSFKYNGYAGHPVVRTPNLDRLSEEGITFEDAYSASPVCVPGRAGLMTGMYPSDVGSYGNSTVWDGSYPVWGSYFENNGYHTQAYGKLDLDDTLPMGFSTDRSANGHKHHPDITSLFRMPLIYRVGEREGIDGKGTRSSGMHDSLVTENAIHFIEKASDKHDRPWMLYLGYIMPHPPFSALKKYFDEYYPDHVDMPEVNEEELDNLSLVYQELRHFKRIATPINKEKIRRARAAYYAMITELDDRIGQVIGALKASGQYGNTIIIYTSDHGESLGEHGLWYKNNLYDCAIRIPLIITGPGIPEGKRVDIPVSQIDLAPTMLQHAGITKPPYLRGKTLDRFFSQGHNHENNVVYAENHSEGNCTGSFMIRKGNWKYIWFKDYDDLLFNLESDPGETVNLSQKPEYAGVLSEMNDILYGLVDPDKITADAFRKQKQMLDDLVRNHTEEELVNILKGRLGEGQAKILAARLKGRY